MSIPVSIRHIVHRGRPSRHRRAALPELAAAVVAAVATLSACSPRQAIVESEPGRAAPSAAGQDALRSDLRRLSAAQDEYLADNGYYAARAQDLGFTASSGVRVDVIQGDKSGWSAVASSGEAECGMYRGAVRAPRSYLTEPGQVACR